MVAQIEERRTALTALCERFGVRRLNLFGSATPGHFDPATSDLDFVAELVETDRPGYARRYIEFAEALEALFGRPVDLLTERMIGDAQFRASLEQTRQRIYERNDERAAS